MLQERGQLGAPQGEAGPSQVGVAGAVHLSQVSQGSLRVLRARRIGDAALGDATNRILGGVLGHRVRPPDHNRGVWQQQTGDERLGRAGCATPAAQNNHLGCAGVAAQVDFGVQLVGVERVVRDVHDDAARMLVGGANRRAHSLAGVALFGEDHEGEHTSAAEAAVVGAQLAQFLVDGGNGGVVQMRNHGRLQARLSRSSISCAERGPHEPDS